MHPSIIKISTDRLKKLRVKVHTQSRIAAIAEHETILTNGTKIDFDFMIFAGGTTTAPCLSNAHLAQTAKGQFIVDDYLRAKKANSIYIVGDSAALSDKKGNPLPPTAQTAIQSGDLDATDIIHTLKDKKRIERLYKWPLWWLASKGFRKIETCEI